MQRSTIEVMYLLRGLMVRYQSKEGNLYIVFIDLKKHDWVPREVL